jgi:creatinine amidohydrolase
MHKTKAAFAAFGVTAALAFSQPAFSAAEPPMAGFTDENSTKIDFGLMTWPVVKAALAAGKTTALFYTGGVEQRGPQNANAGHNLMGTATVRAIATKLGNAIAMPVLPYTPNNASAEQPGTIGLTPELLAMVLERLSEQAIASGFKNVVIMGDHGGGQPKSYEDVAKKLGAKYAAQGVHVYYCDEVYRPANDAFDKYLADNGFPPSQHGGLPDTAEMLYLGGDAWVRKDLIATALGDPVPPPGTPFGGGVQKIKNGIIGDGRRATPELGKRLFDMKVDFAVKQIKALVGPAKAAH